MTDADTSGLKAFLTEDARRLGFSALGVAPGEGDGLAGERLAEFVEAGRHGTMGWMPETLDRRRRYGLTCARLSSWP